MFTASCAAGGAGEQETHRPDLPAATGRPAAHPADTRRGKARESNAVYIPEVEFPIIYEDDALLAVNKPAGVAVHGGSGVSFGVIEQMRRARPQAKFLELVHRLDRETPAWPAPARLSSA